MKEDEEKEMKAKDIEMAGWVEPGRRMELKNEKRIHTSPESNISVIVRPPVELTQSIWFIIFCLTFLWLLMFDIYVLVFYIKEYYCYLCSLDGRTTVFIAKLRNQNTWYFWNWDLVNCNEIPREKCISSQGTNNH